MRQSLEEQKLLQELEQASLAGTLNAIGRHCQAVTKRWPQVSPHQEDGRLTLYLTPMIAGYPAFMHISGAGLTLLAVDIMYRIVGRYEEPIPAEGLTVFFDFSSIERINPGEELTVQLVNYTPKSIDAVVTLFLR